MKKIYKAAGIIITNKKLLLEKSYGKDYYKSPGGGIEQGETPTQALVRELQEEFQITVQESDLEYFGTFTALAEGTTDTQVCIESYVVKKWIGIPAPDNEVEEILWADSSTVGTVMMGSVFEHEIIPRLKKQNIID